MATQAPKPPRKKIIHQLDTPFSSAQWPDISAADQETILELLCSLLQPIGHHRSNHVKVSKGKRAAKRRKLSSQSSAETAEEPKVPKPALENHISVGFNSITRNLQQDCPRDMKPLPEKKSEVREDAKTEAERRPERRHYSMIFVARGNQPSSFSCQFPQMVSAASKGLDPSQSIRLIGFSKPCSDRISGVLGVARVSSIAIASDAPGSAGLLTFVREHVPPVSVPWLDDAGSIDYLGTQIKSEETTVGQRRERAAQ